MERLLRDSWKQYMAPAEIGSLSEETGRTQSILQIGIHLEENNTIKAGGSTARAQSKMSEWVSGVEWMDTP